MSEKEDKKEKGSGPSRDRIEEMREKMREAQEKGEGPGRPSGRGLASMMQRMAGGPGGNQNRATLEMMKGIKGDTKKIKEYLKKILEKLEEE